jgi:glycosyltransferase involved in cell wall biosynthesis
MLRVSIVIPTKNEEKFIGKTLDHLYNQLKNSRPKQDFLFEEVK